MRQAYNVGNFGSVPAFGGSSREFVKANFDKITIPAITLTGDLSISFWIRGENLHAGYGSMVIGGGAATSGSDHLGYIWLWNFGGTTRRFSWRLDGEITALQNLSFTGDIDDGAWHHVTCWRAGASCKLFLDGIELLSGVGSTNDFHIRNIGNSYLFSAFGTEGQMADVRFFNRALEEAEITSLASGEHVAGDNFEGWYLLDSDDVLDYSGNGNHGTNDGSVFSTDGPLD